jgi:predicted Zn-dependent protease
MPGRLRRFLLFPRRYPFRSLLLTSLLTICGYLFWQATPGAQFHREYDEAQRTLSEFDFAAARGHLAECIRLRPDDPNVRLMAAQTARRDGDLEAADQLLGEYHQFFSDVNPEERLEWALQQAQVGKFANVIDFLIECLEVRHPSSERIFEALAMGSAQVYNLDRASFWVGEMLDKFPKNPVGRLIRLQTLETLGHREDLLPPLRELVAEYPRYTNARQHLADTLFWLQQYDEAAKEYESLVAQVPNRPMALLGLARCQIKTGRTSAASDLLRKLQEQFPGNSEVLLECGRCALREDRFGDAESLLRRAVEMAPDDHQIHLELGICLQKIGRSEESKQHIDKAKRIEADLAHLEKAVDAMIQNPSDPEPRLLAGQICLRNGQVAEGLRWLNGALERKPDHKPTHRALADYYDSQGDSQQAEWHRRRVGQTPR